MKLKEALKPLFDKKPYRDLSITKIESIAGLGRGTLTKAFKANSIRTGLIERLCAPTGQEMHIIFKKKKKLILNIDEGVVFTGPNITVNVTKMVYETWLLHRQMESIDDEKFGVLIGSRVEGESIIWIEAITLPQEGDPGCSTDDLNDCFVMEDPYHQKRVDEAHESDSELGYIGTWHTNPLNNSIPSNMDQCALSNTDRRLLFVMVGNNSIHIYVRINDNLEILTRQIKDLP